VSIVPQSLRALAAAGESSAPSSAGDDGAASKLAGDDALLRDGRDEPVSPASMAAIVVLTATGGTDPLLTRWCSRVDGIAPPGQLLNVAAIWSRSKTEGRTAGFGCAHTHTHTYTQHSRRRAHDKATAAHRSTEYGAHAPRDTRE
jgi:hypothetical protein